MLMTKLRNLSRKEGKVQVLKKNNGWVHIIQIILYHNILVVSKIFYSENHKVSSWHSFKEKEILQAILYKPLAKEGRHKGFGNNPKFSNVDLTFIHSRYFFRSINISINILYFKKKKKNLFSNKIEKKAIQEP